MGTIPKDPVTRKGAMKIAPFFNYMYRLFNFLYTLVIICIKKS